MKLHYLFGSRYAVTDYNNTQDLRHRNAVFGVHDQLHDFGYDIQYHYHNKDAIDSLSFGPNDIAINIHPQLQQSFDLMREAKTNNTLCGSFLDTCDIPMLSDPDSVLVKAIKKSDFVMVPNAIASKLTEKYNSRISVVPPLVENKSALPMEGLCDIKKRKRPLRILSVVEPDQQDGFIHLLSSLIQVGKRYYPIEIDLFIREATGMYQQPDTDTLRQAAMGMVRLTKNKRIQFTIHDMNQNVLNETIGKTDLLLVAPNDDVLSGNIQLPMMGINAGKFVMLPTKSKIYGPIYEYGTVPYNPDHLRKTIAGLVMDPTIHFRGKTVHGQSIVKNHHTPDKIAALYDRIFKSETRNHALKNSRKAVASNPHAFWQKVQEMQDVDLKGTPYEIKHHPMVLPEQKSNTQKDELRVRRIEAVS